MPAAMTVSLLVGTLRTLAHFTNSPSEILAAMHQRMLARSQGGFTTCLVLRASPDCTLTFANAGHLAPYLRGTEVEMVNGLPLGLAEQHCYPETAFVLPENAQLMLVTDGVVEARARSGELLGLRSRCGAIHTDGRIDRPCGSSFWTGRRHYRSDLVAQSSLRPAHCRSFSAEPDSFGQSLRDFFHKNPVGFIAFSSPPCLV